MCKIKQVGACKIKAGGGNDAQPQQRVADRSATEGADSKRSSEDGVLFSQTRWPQIERRISFSYSFFYINQSSAQSAKVSIYTKYITESRSKHQQSKSETVFQCRYQDSVTKPAECFLTSIACERVC